MKRKLFLILALSVPVSIFSLPLLAHHGYVAYDLNKTVSLRGTVTLWFWANPHCVLQLDVTNENGQVTHWTVETENPTTMTNLGWSKQSLRPGDQVTANVIPVKNGKPVGRLREILLASGQRLPGPPSVQGFPGEGFSKPGDSPKQ